MFVRKKIHDKYSLLAYYKHLKLKKLGGIAERCGTEDIRVKCNAPNTVYNGNCGPEAIRVWLLALPHSLASIPNKQLDNLSTSPQDIQITL